LTLPITDKQAEDIYDYRLYITFFESIYQLREIDSIDQRTLNRLKPLVVISHFDDRDEAAQRRDEIYYLIQRLGSNEGFQEGMSDLWEDYLLTPQNVNSIDGESALWKEPSAFEILGKDITTNIIIEEFIEVSKVSKDVTTRLTSDAQKSVLGTLDNNIDTEPPVQGAVFKPILSEETPVSSNGLYLPVFTGGGGNTTSFHIQIDDPITAGKQFSDEFDDPTIGRDLVYTYSNDDFLGDFGELRDFRFFLVSDVDLEDDGSYPLLTSSQANAFNNKALTATNIIDLIDKDKNAKFAVTFQQHIVTDNKNVIIGSGFAKYNRLFSDRTLPTKQIYKSDKPYSVFDNKVRSNDTLLVNTWSVNENTRKLTFNVSNAEHIALTYGNEIVLAFNHIEEGISEYYINFLSAAEREVLNEFTTPDLVSFTTQPTSISLDIRNTDDEEASIEVGLLAETQTETLEPNEVKTFTFTSLQPNTSFTVNAKAFPVGVSEKNPSSTVFFTIKTPILPTDPPIAVEKEAAANGQGVVYTFTNPNDFGTQLFVRIET